MGEEQELKGIRKPLGKKTPFIGFPKIQPLQPFLYSSGTTGRFTGTTGKHGIPLLKRPSGTTGGATGSTGRPEPTGTTAPPPPNNRREYQKVITP